MKNIEQVKQLFPEVIREGKIDFDALKAVLGAEIDDSDERYNFTWHGKTKARHIAQTPSTGTLRPCKEESVNWDSTKNLFIEGDNLEVLKLLQKSYHKKVRIIYIDPPYNTGKDFVYKDNFHDNIQNYFEQTGQVDGAGHKLSTNTDLSGRYHSTWLSMIYPRLKLARHLLCDDGVIFISIDDGEAKNLRAVCDEIFGEDNFKSDICWQKRYTRSNNTVDFTTVVEHILVYAKSDKFVVNLLPRTKEADARYTNPDNDPRGVWKGASFLNPATPDERPNLAYSIVNPNTGEETPATKNAWRRSKEEFDKLQKDGRLYWGSNGKSPVPSIKMFLSEARGLTPINFWDHVYAGNTDEGSNDFSSLFGNKMFNNPKPILLIQRVIEHAVVEGAIILDFFAGSGSTAHAVINYNANNAKKVKFICVQLPEQTNKKGLAYKNGYKNIAEITKERIRRAGRKHLDSAATVDIGFRVFKLAQTNICLWDADFANLEDVLKQSTKSIKEGRSSEDVLYEILLKYGYELTTPVDTKTLNGKTVFVVGVGALIVCLENGITAETVESIAKLKTDLNSETTQVVFKDEGFADDKVKTNAIQILKQAGIDDVKSI